MRLRLEYAIGRDQVSVNGIIEVWRYWLGLHHLVSGGGKCAYSQFHRL